MGGRSQGHKKEGPSRVTGAKTKEEERAESPKEEKEEEELQVPYQQIFSPLFAAFCLRKNRTKQ